MCILYFSLNECPALSGFVLNVDAKQGERKVHIHVIWLNAFCVLSLLTFSRSLFIRMIQGGARAMVCMPWDEDVAQFKSSIHISVKYTHSTRGDDIPWHISVQNKVDKGKYLGWESRRGTNCARKIQRTCGIVLLSTIRYGSRKNKRFPEWKKRLNPKSKEADLCYDSIPRQVARTNYGYLFGVKKDGTSWLWYELFRFICINNMPIMSSMSNRKYEGNEDVSFKCWRWTMSSRFRCGLGMGHLHNRYRVNFMDSCATYPQDIVLTHNSVFIYFPFVFS